jgi:ribosomal protein S18 acetylase RimI-like enzyme
MPDLKLLPISHADYLHLTELMSEEEAAWMAELDWDYSPIRRILESFMRQRLLPGFVAYSESRAIGYTYFLVHQRKGIIGALYASNQHCTQQTADHIIALAVESLQASENIRRIEAQIIPFHNIDLNSSFLSHGFHYYPRYYLELDLSSYLPRPESHSAERIVPWKSDLLPGAAEVILQSYRNQMDAEICEDYRTPAGGSGYLRSLVENPGCGIFLAEGSFVGLDSQGLPCGFVIASRISEFAGMIPQIAIGPAHQGRGLGSRLMDKALAHFQSQGFRSASLTVTKRNRRALDWYRRLGFKIRKEFGAYIWERNG